MTYSKVPIENLWKKYKETKSVWKTAGFFGLCGQTVHERLKKNGYKLYGESFSKEEDKIIKDTYLKSIGKTDLNLPKLAIRLGRNYHTNVSRRAKKLGLTYSRRKHTIQQRDKETLHMLSKIKIGILPRSYENITKDWFYCANGNKYFLKSGWEIRYAEYLEMLLKKKAILEWEYEPDIFWFEKIRRGVRSYTPDFKITFKDGSIEYHEIKGWLDSKSKTKIKRMKIYHPKIKLVVIMKQDLKTMGLI